MAKPLTLSTECCRARQARVVELLRQNELDAALFSTRDNVYYLTGFHHHRLMNAAVWLDAGGCCLLVAPNSEPKDCAADDIATFEAQWRSTLRQEQVQSVADVLRQTLGPAAAVNRLGVEGNHFAPHYREALQLSGDVHVENIEQQVWYLRRNKFDDEVAMIRRAVACTEAMYARAREIIRPGITELDVFNHLHAAAVEVAGEPLTDLGNDYQSNSPGGPPRERAAHAGELMILDLGPAYRGYYADNCRTFAVSGEATEQQMTAWRYIVSALDHVEATVKPGVSCRELFNTVQSMLDEYREAAFFHHLGHGFGIFPHEAPHLNPNWDDTFEEGDLFTAEPGLYGNELRAGIRLEQNYRVTADGVERLTQFPLDLA